MALDGSDRAASRSGPRSPGKKSLEYATETISVGPQGGCVHCGKDNNLRPRREYNSFQAA